MEQNLVPILQAAISPAILISAAGLILLSMTNRLGRVIDRSRELARSHRAAADPERDRLGRQLRVLTQRATSMRLAITFCSLSALLAATLMIAIFLNVIFERRFLLFSVGLFIACLACLIAALVFFLHDIHLSLTALKLELESVDKNASDYV